MIDDDNQLDEILRSLHQEQEPTGSMTDIRTRLLAAADSVGGAPARIRHRRRFPLVPVAAGLAVVIAGVTAVSVSMHVHSGHPASNVAGAATSQHASIPLDSGASALDAAATLTASSSDAPLRPGQFRYVRSEGWNTESVITLSGPGQGGYTYLVHHVTEDWIPADYTKQWEEKRTIVGAAKLLGGSMPAAKTPKFTPLKYDQGTLLGDCGNFFPNAQGVQKCGDPTNWDMPTFYAKLPRDPDGLVAFLRQVTAPKGSEPSTMFDYGVQMMGTGMMPADLLSPFYRALAKIPGVQVLAKQVTIAGRTGVALGIDDRSAELDEMIVDPQTGQLIGTRSVAGPHPDNAWIKPGTVLSDSAISTGVATRLGQAPTTN